MKHIELETLNDVWLRVEEPLLKPMIFILVPKQQSETEIDYHLNSFVNLSSLSKDLQQKIRTELKLTEENKNEQ